MSEYNDPNNQDFAQGYTDQGGYGDFSAGYDFTAGYDQPAATEEVVYGDEGPSTGTSGDEAYAAGYDQGEAQAGYDQAAYDPQQGYDQAGYDQTGYEQQPGHEQTGYEQAGYDQAGYDQTGYEQTGYDQAGYDQTGYEQTGYEQTGYEQGYGDYSQGYDEQPAYAEDDGNIAPEDEVVEEGAAAAGKRKMLMLAGVGLALLIGLGGAGYYMIAQGDEGGGESAPGFDLASITRMIPFLGPKDTDATLGTLQDNAGNVKLAVDAYAREHGELPSTGAAVSAQLRKMKRELVNPYNAEEPVTIEVGDTPTAPGAIAYSRQGKRYSLTVGDVAGQPLALEGQLFELTGRVTAAKPVQKAAAGAKPAPAAKAAAKPASKAAGGDATPTRTAAADDGVATPEPMARPNQGATGAKKKDELEAFIKNRITSPAPTAVAKVVPSEVLVRRNQEFDRWRSRGIALVYEQRTSESIAAFKRALALRPGDPSVTRWLSTIQGVIDKHTTEERDRYEKEKAEALKQNVPLAVPIRAGGPMSGTTGAPAGRGDDDAMKMLREMQKQDKVPLLAPPKLDE